MADTAISALSALGAQPASTDLIPLVDVSDTTMSGNGTTKNVTYAYLTTGLLTDITGEAIGSLSDVTITTVADNEVLAYDSTAVGWVNQTAAEAGLAAASHTHVEADITDLGAYLTDITAESLGDLSDVTITTGAQGDILYYNGSAWVNLAPGTSGYFLKTQGAAANPTWDAIPGGGDMLAATYDADTDGVVDASEGVTFVARKASVGTITKGTPVYIVSYNVAGYIEVEAADADDAAKMPAVGVVTADMTNSADGYVLGLGQLDDIDTSSYSVGDDLYVSTATGLTSTKPTGDAEAIQKIAEVGRSHAVNGMIIVFGAGRSNDVSNKIDQKTLVLKQGAAPAPTAEGDIQWDTDDNRLAVGDGVGTVTFSNDTTNASTYAAASHAHAASDITSGTLAHERGGIEADISTVTTGDILAGTGAGTIGIVSAAGKSDGDVLTLQADGTVAYETPAGGSGQSTYDAIVAASGGDYTTLTAALTAGATSVFVKDGTYTEAGGSFSTANLNIVGESNGGAILNFGTNAFTLSGENVTVRNVKMTTSGAATINFSGSNATIENNIIADASGSARTGRLLQVTGTGSRVIGNYVESAYGYSAGNLVLIAGYDETVSNNMFYVNCQNTSGGAVKISEQKITFSGNVLKSYTGSSANGYLFEAAGYFDLVTANVFDCVAAIGNPAIRMSQAYITVTNNYIYLSKKAITLSSGGTGSMVAGNVIYLNNSSTYGFYDTGAQGVNFQNNTIIDPYLNATCAVQVRGENNTYSNNVIRGVTNAFDVSTYSTHKNNTYTNNQVEKTIPLFNAALTTVGNIVADNGGEGAKKYEMQTSRQTNGTAGTLTAGDVVVYGTDAGGVEVGTTTTAGDARVFGMVEESILTTAKGSVKTLGYTNLLKVDGTTDIAVGDLLSTFTTAGIAKKASAGETAFAIALEAYTTDDSNGVIDAILITPRQV